MTVPPASPSPRPRLLVVHHAPTDQVRSLVQAVLDGARHAALALGVDGEPAIDLVHRSALEPDPFDVRTAAGVVLVTTCNFGYMSGALKHFFDTTFRDLEGHTDGMPWSLVAKGTTDVSGVRRSVEPIATGLGWRLAAAPVEIEGDVEAHHLDAATELAQTMTALVATA